MGDQKAFNKAGSKQANLHRAEGPGESPKAALSFLPLFPLLSPQAHAFPAGLHLATEKEDQPDPRSPLRSGKQGITS